MSRLLVPVAASPTLRRTVEYAVESVVHEADAVTLRAIYLPPLRPGTNLDRGAGEAVLESVTDWVSELTDGVHTEVVVETAIPDAAASLYTPLDIAEVLREEVLAHDIDWVVLDPGYAPRGERGFLDPIERILTEETDAAIEVAPFTAYAGRLPGPLDGPRIVFIFTISLAFYLVLAGGLSAYALVTGAITATLVTATLGAVSLWFPPAVRYTPMRFVRSLVFLPYLLVSIIRANLDVSRVILHPALPIEPQVVRYHPAVYGPFPLTTLANSITLTPGTLSMRVDEGDLIVHTLTPDAREGLHEGGLERAVRFLFFGRPAMRVATPAERDDVSPEPASSEEGDG